MRLSGNFLPKGRSYFVLWGKFAEAKETLIDKSKHFILTAPHPSPFSANRGFSAAGIFHVSMNCLNKWASNK